jgi:subtilisin family serine protease
MVAKQSLRLGVLSAFSVVALSSCGGNYGAKLHTYSGSSKMEGRYVIELNDDVASFAWEQAVAVAPIHVYREVLNGFAADLSPSQLQNMLRNPSVKAVYETGHRKLVGEQTNATWGVDRLDQVGPTLDSKFKYQADGKGVTAYIIDTGIAVKHPDFEGRAVFGADVTKDKGTSKENIDGHGHGSHVAGTVGSKTWGVAKGVKLVAVKVFDSTGGEADDATVLAGVDFAIADHKANPTPAVINMSLGGEKSDILDAGVKKASESGIVVVVAAGNDNDDACSYSPAREPAMITVASMANGDRKSSFSNWGKCVDVIAPGSRITSASNRGSGSATMDGTSMASPHVAGVAAVVLSANPKFSVEQVAEFIKKNAQKDVVTGFSKDTPNLLASLVWNAPAAKAGDPWTESFTMQGESGSSYFFPSEAGIEAIAGNELSANMRAASWMGGGNCDLFLHRAVAGSNAQFISGSENSGMKETVAFKVSESGRYYFEVKCLSSGKFILSATLQ